VTALLGPTLTPVHSVSNQGFRAQLPSSLIECKGMSRSRTDKARPALQVAVPPLTFKDSLQGCCRALSGLDRSQQRPTASISGGGVSHLCAPVEPDGQSRWRPSSQSQFGHHVPAKTSPRAAWPADQQQRHRHHPVG